MKGFGKQSMPMLCNPPILHSCFSEKEETIMKYDVCKNFYFFHRIFAFEDESSMYVVFVVCFNFIS